MVDTRLIHIDFTKYLKRENYTINIIEKPSNIPNVADGSIFVPPSKDNTKFYIFGGYFPDVNKTAPTYVKPEKDRPGDLISYDVKTNKWEKATLAKNSQEVIWPQAGASISIPEKGLGFYLGGYQDGRANSALGENKTFFRVDPGFLRLEWETGSGSDPTPKWTNESIPFNQIIGGSVVHIPEIGEQGILVRAGGFSATSGSEDRSTREFAPMDTVHVYDIASKKWQPQVVAATAGDNVYPNGRAWACSFVVPAKDNSSYNIYLYGGGGDGGGDGLDEMWVLTLPAFQWVFLFKRNLPTIGMTCHRLTDNHVVIVGPRLQRFADTGNAAEECRPLWSMYDISRDTWDPYFDPANTDKAAIHPKISNVIGGGENGNATITEPKSGWTKEELKAIFLGNGGKDDDVPNNSTAGGGGNGDKATDSKSDADSSTADSPTSRPALIGGIAGGVAAVLILVGCLVQRKYRRRRIRGFGLFSRRPKGYQDSLCVELEGPRPPQEMAAQFPWPHYGPDVPRSELESGPYTPPPGQQENKEQQKFQGPDPEPGVYPGRPISSGSRFSERFEEGTERTH